ncbi:endolysin [Allosphingosinicella indica]|uniref:Peptidoglycan L-alanyl-D-glutamate endopeptidase CwlK n=1 Tax=Allosphingosinicella indica TaxID=941907 RepID=A0A1X7GIV4_9SPHN|nr:endolysin [Allosphingosinicella indica]SMF70489.1 peptidoglycan L-alanyl-D-glutamate endopeptidase CwlK [Allosphingosinicella indica]
MGYTLGARSRAEFAGVRYDLGSVVHEAIKITAQDFSVHDGLRTEAEQRALMKSGASKTMNSKHLPQADGFGHAVDLVPFINGKLRWEWKPIFHIAAAVRKALDIVNAERKTRNLDPLKLIWGGVWDRDFAALPADAAGMEQAVNAYVARRRGAGKTAFIDGPHFEIA